MTPLLRIAELAVFLLLVAWTMIFPLATLLSLGVTLPLAAVATGRWTRMRPASASRARAIVTA